MHCFLFVLCAQDDDDSVPDRDAAGVKVGIAMMESTSGSDTESAVSNDRYEYEEIDGAVYRDPQAPTPNYSMGTGTGVDDPDSDDDVIDELFLNNFSRSSVVNEEKTDSADFPGAVRPASLDISGDYSRHGAESTMSPAATVAWPRA